MTAALRTSLAGAAPDRECALCPRLATYRAANRRAERGWHNAPVGSFEPVTGAATVRLLVVGLAPGLKGANRTGRPFTGDCAGDLLYPTLARFGLARGAFAARADDGLELVRCQITNAVRCVPPHNRPTGLELRTCRRFLVSEIRALASLEAILALGTVAHATVLAALGQRQKDYPFSHGAMHRLACGLWLADSYHCSRYNVNTGRLTPAMFEAVFTALRRCLDGTA